MKFNKIMKAYFQNKLDQIDEIQPKFRLTERPVSNYQFAIQQRLENIIGIGITVCYLLQLLLPAHWFSIGRFFSIFKIGF